MWAKQKQAGFTIVELLIVIVVIAILAAITIVSYNGITNRAHASSVKSDFGNFVKKMEIFKADSSTATYPAVSSNTDLISVGVQISKGSYNALIYCRNSSGTAYAITGDGKDGKTYAVNSLTSSVIELTGPVQGNGGASACTAAGVSGSWLWLLQTPTTSWGI